MPIFIGSTDIDEITIGTTKQQSVYVGSDRVWVRPLFYNLEHGIASPTSGVTWHGYLTTEGTYYNMGSISLNTTHNPYYANWFIDSNGVSNATYFRSLYWREELNELYFALGSNTTSASTIPNTDATFSKLSIGTHPTDPAPTYTFNRADADSYTTYSSHYSMWTWTNVTDNPFPSGGSNFAIRRIRIDKP